MTVSVILARWADGYIEQIHNVPVGGHREKFLSLGTLSVDAARAETVPLVTLLANPERTSTVIVEPAGTVDTPYVGFFVGDLITAPDIGGVGVSRRVVGLNVAEDDDGAVSFIPLVSPP